MGTDPSADSGAKTDRGGTMPPSLGRDWHEGDKSKRVQSVAYITNRKVHFRLNHYSTRSGASLQNLEEPESLET